MTYLDCLYPAKIATDRWPGTPYFPGECPKCHKERLVSRQVDINLTESFCAGKDCTYAVLDRQGGLIDAEQIRRQLPEMWVGRR